MSEAQSASETVEDPIRVLVADDEETVVDVLRSLIGSDPSLRFVGAAHNAEDAIEMTARERPDVVLLDVRMPGGGGLRATREITKRCAPTKVVALSAHQDSDTVIGMISAGASGYVPKGDPTEKILRTIHRAMDPDYVAEEAGPQLALVSPMLPHRTQQRTAVARAILDGVITAEFEPIAELATGRSSDSMRIRAWRPSPTVPTTPGWPTPRVPTSSSTSSCPRSEPVCRHCR